MHLIDAAHSWKVGGHAAGMALSANPQSKTGSYITNIRGWRKNQRGGLRLSVARTQFRPKPPAILTDAANIGDAVLKPGRGFLR